jgi:hypothetical protein
MFAPITLPTKIQDSLRNQAITLIELRPWLGPPQTLSSFAINPGSF